MIPDLLVLPPATDLHNHPLVTNGSVFMQVRFSNFFILVYFISAIITLIYIYIFFRVRQVPWWQLPLGLNQGGKHCN